MQSHRQPGRAFQCGRRSFTHRTAVTNAPAWLLQQLHPRNSQRRGGVNELLEIGVGARDDDAERAVRGSCGAVHRWPRRKWRRCRWCGCVHPSI
eukprot:366387-Chlamydomonas_euryale.AAC.3